MDNLIEYVLIGLLVVIILQLLFNASGCKGEPMGVVENGNDKAEASENNADENSSYSENNSAQPLVESADGSSSESVEESVEESTDGSPELLEEGPAPVETEAQKLQQPHFNTGGCPVEPISSVMDRYTKNMLMRELPNCDDSGNETNLLNKSFGKLTEDEKQKQDKKERKKVTGYHDDQLDFYGKINNTSKDGSDPVDKVNEYVYNGDRSIRGKTVNKLYDVMTSNDAMNCVKGFCDDRMNVVPNHKLSGANGSVYRDDLWLYENEKVSNGGKFYHDVYPVDDDESGYLVQ